MKTLLLSYYIPDPALTQSLEDYNSSASPGASVPLSIRARFAEVSCVSCCVPVCCDFSAAG